MDARCPYWGPAQEIESNAEADAVAASLYQPTGESKDEFFHQTPAQIFAHLLKYGPTPRQLADWLASDKELLAKVQGTEMAFYIDQNAGPQRAGVLLRSESWQSRSGCFQQRRRRMASGTLSPGLNLQGLL